MSAALIVLAGVLHGCGGGEAGGGVTDGLPDSSSERATGLGLAIKDTSDGVPYSETADRPLYDVNRTSADGLSVLAAAGATGESDYAPTSRAVPDPGPDWNGLVLAKDGEGVTEYVTFLTDIEEPSPQLFRMRYSDAERTDIFSGPDGTARVDSRLLASSHFPPSSASYIYSDTHREPSFRGAFDGVPGLFECARTSGACTLTADGNGKLRQGAGDRWQFIADAPNDATVAVRDADFRYFGWWVEEPNEAGPNGFVYKFATFSGGSAPFEPDTTMAAVAGTATFEGQSAGRYVTRFSPDGSAVAGTFTADAELTADFGDGVQAGTLEGTMTHFHDQDGDHLDWEITLASDEIGSTGAVEGDATGRIQSNQSGTGSWTASFFGNDRNDGRPGSLSGEFVLSFVSIADLAGGFAASNTSPDE